MGRLFKILIVVLVLVVGVALAAPFFIPVDVYRGEIIRAAREQTGRELNIEGDLSLRFLPTARLSAHDVTLSNAPGGRAANMMEMGALSFDLRLMPLLRGELVINQLVLSDAVIHLEVDRQGRNNWTFDPPARPARDDGGTGDNGGGLRLADVQLGDVRLERSRLTYLNAQTGDDYDITDINATVSMPRLDGPIGVRGDFVHNGEKVDLTLEGGNARALFDGETAPVKLGLRAAPVNLSFEGEGALNRSPGAKLPVSGSGAADIRAPSLARLMRWLGTDGMAGGDLGALSLRGDARASGDNLTFSKARLRLGEATGEGDVTLNVAGARPALRGALTLDRLDLRPLMGDGTARGAAGQAGARGWSTETMDLTGLRAFDADFTLSAGSIVTPTVNMGDSQVALRIVNGLLTANLTRMALYGGRGTALLEIDARGNVPTIRNRVEFDAIEALAFLTDAAGFDRLEGLGRLNWDVTTRGRSQRDWASAINGTGALTFNDGAIRGINFPQLVRDVQAFATGQAIERSQQKTDFTELGGTFRITNGVLENSDMRLVGPLLRMIGQGRVNLAERTLDYRLRPQFVATLEGQGATRDVTGRAVPVRVTGSWDDLRFAPDVEDIGRSVIDRLLRPREERQDEQTDSQEDEEEERTRPEDLLRRLFGGD